MDQRESQRYARTICEYADSKKVCGRILNKFTYSYTVEVASIFIHDIITLDFFQDLKGSMKEFLIELPISLKEPVNTLLSESHRRDNEGEIIESDQDSQGNLKYGQRVTIYYIYIFYIYLNKLIYIVVV